MQETTETACYGTAQKCPSSAHLKSFVMEKFEEWDPNDEVTYSACISTNGTQQVHFTFRLEEYLETLIESLIFTTSYPNLQVLMKTFALSSIFLENPLQ